MFVQAGPSVRPPDSDPSDSAAEICDTYRRELSL
jgi:hypothetical protein